MIDVLIYVDLATATPPGSNLFGQTSFNIRFQKMNKSRCKQAFKMTRALYKKLYHCTFLQ